MCSDDADVTLTIRPQPAATIGGAKARQVRYGPMTLTWSVVIQSSGSLCVTPSRGPNTPAAFTSTVGGAAHASTAARRRSTSSGSRTSAAKPFASPPAAVRSSATSSSASAERLTSATRQPSRARPSAIARPMPRLAPVTRAVPRGSAVIALAPAHQPELADRIALLDQLLHRRVDAAAREVVVVEALATTS